MLIIRDIKRKIRMVQGMQQITGAMKLIAAARLKRVQESLYSARPYFERLQEVLQILLPRAPKVYHPLTVKREAKTMGIFVISSDRGLCGPFNFNVFERVNEVITKREEGQEVKIIALGRKGAVAFKRLDYPIIASFDYPSASPAFSELKPIIETVKALYENGEVDIVYAVYTLFVGLVKFHPTVIQVLPIEFAWEEVNAKEIEFIYEPAPEMILKELLPRYFSMHIFRIVLESLASEHAARLLTMTAATDNAQDMLDDLNVLYNRARQEAITKELMDIVGTAEALR